jgi:uncharacterized protein (TIGR03083 family)
MANGPPIPVAHLFAELHQHLLSLLESLDDEDWHRPTICSLWNVKDIASHLLDGSLRRLSIQRDGYFAPNAPGSFPSHAALAYYLHELNATWTDATRRLSPRMLIDLHRYVGPQLNALFEAADPFAPALFPVAWAGDEHSEMWFDIAREYTEKWHHQRQIAAAVQRPTPIDAPRLYHPALETFLRALPYTFREIEAVDGTAVAVQIVGDAGGRWVIRRAENEWSIDWSPHPGADAEVLIDQEIAWKVFTKRMTIDDARHRFPTIKLLGDTELASHVLELVAIMA